MVQTESFTNDKRQGFKLYCFATIFLLLYQVGSIISSCFTLLEAFELETHHKLHESRLRAILEQGRSSNTADVKGSHRSSLPVRS